MTNYAINLEVITDEATQSLYKLDRKYIGTPNYMGLAYFWGQEYKHYLRDATVSQRRRIHNKGLKENVSFLVPNDEAWSIIKKITGIY